MRRGTGTVWAMVCLVFSLATAQGQAAGEGSPQSVTKQGAGVEGSGTGHGSPLLAAASQAAWSPQTQPAVDDAGTVSALFFGSRLENQINPQGGMDLVAVREYLVLLKTGQVYSGLPKDGHVLDMDFAAACRKRPTSCGTYRIRNGKIFFTWQQGYGLVREEQSAFKRKDASDATLIYNNTLMGQVQPAHNLRLRGRYTTTFYVGGSTSTTSVSAQTFIAFTPDGRYQKSGFTSVTFSNGGASGTTQGSQGVEMGQYAINGFTLTLTPHTGRPEVYTIVFETISESPSGIFINDNAFLR